MLKDARLVRDRRVGNRRLYGIDPDGMTTLREYAQSFWSAALTRYAKAAERISDGQPNADA